MSQCIECRFSLKFSNSNLSEVCARKENMPNKLYQFIFSPPARLAWLTAKIYDVPTEIIEIDLSKGQCGHSFKVFSYAKQKIYIFSQLFQLLLVEVFTICIHEFIIPNLRIFTTFSFNQAKKSSLFIFLDIFVKTI